MEKYQVVERVWNDLEMVEARIRSLFSRIKTWSVSHSSAKKDSHAIFIRSCKKSTRRRKAI